VKFGKSNGQFAWRPVCVLRASRVL